MNFAAVSLFLIFANIPMYSQEPGNAPPLKIKRRLPTQPTTQNVAIPELTPTPKPEVVATPTPKTDKFAETVARANKYFILGKRFWSEGFKYLARAEWKSALEVLRDSDVPDSDRPRILDTLEKMADDIYRIENGVDPPPKAISEQTKTPFIPPEIKSSEADALAYSKFLKTKPVPMKNGSYKVVIDYLNEYLNDPYTMKIVRWHKPVAVIRSQRWYWAIRLRYRARNEFGAYVLAEELFLVLDNKVTRTEKAAFK